MFSYSAPAESRVHLGRMTSELVGLGRFELPASSSRTQVLAWAASAAALVACDRPSVGVR